jgi:hypothetical protein
MAATVLVSHLQVSKMTTGQELTTEQTPTTMTLSLSSATTSPTGNAVNILPSSMVLYHPPISVVINLPSLVVNFPSCESTNLSHLIQTSTTTTTSLSKPQLLGIIFGPCAIISVLLVIFLWKKEYKDTRKWEEEREEGRELLAWEENWDRDLDLGLEEEMR